jgi:hypothetical protein
MPPICSPNPSVPRLLRGSSHTEEHQLDNACVQPHGEQANVSICVCRKRSAVIATMSKALHGIQLESTSFHRAQTAPCVSCA